MSEVDPEGTVSVSKAAELLGLSVDEAYDLVFSRRLTSAEAESGRRVVPLEAIDAWRQRHPDRAPSRT